MNNKLFTLIIVISGLLFFTLLTHNADLAWMAIPFMAYLGIGILQSPTKGNINLHAERSVEQNMMGETTSIEVRVAIRNLGDTIHQLCLTDPLQAGMHITDGQLKQVVALRSTENTIFRYAFQAERGNFAWKNIHVVISDPLGLIETELEIPAEAEIQKQPEIKKFRPFPLRPQRTLHSTGSIPARLGGRGTDFWGIREYQPGDPLRRLDWRLTARYPGKFFSKEFEQEEIADVGIILDGRRSTDLRLGDDSLFEHSVSATASLAEVFLRQGNRVSLLIYSKPMVKIYPGYGKVQLNRIMRSLARVNTDMEGSLSSLQDLPVQMFSSHSLILVISPLASNDWLLFPRLRALGYQVLLISPDPINYAQSLLPGDSATLLANRLTGLERKLEIAKITQKWIPVIDWQVNQPLAPLLRNTLSHIHIQRES